MLGEGKPENQNHAIIFTRGEGLQTIDMNQVSTINFEIYSEYSEPFPDVHVRMLHANR